MADNDQSSYASTMARHPGHFNIHAPLGTWWQLRSFDLNERAPSCEVWMRNRDRTPKGIGLLQHVVSGAIKYRDSRSEHDVNPGWAALMMSGDDSEYRIAGKQAETVSQWVSFSGAGLAEHWSDIRSRFGSVVYLGTDSPVLDAIKNLCSRERPVNTTETVLAAAALHAFMVTLYSWLEKSSAQIRPPVERALEDLFQYGTSNFSIKEIAARHGCSREHLTRLFVQRHGVSPARYLARVRTARAVELLRDTRLPVPRVAKQCGFSSKHSLIRWLRREFGELPSQIRKRLS
jgi:AraC-like DNA-binding protein